jgi:hypothetical protein
MKKLQSQEIRQLYILPGGFNKVVSLCMQRFLMMFFKNINTQICINLVTYTVGYKIFFFDFVKKIKNTDPLMGAKFKSKTFT